MEETGITFDEALAEAQSKGYAEANPALDIDGHDTAHKACILASLAYGRAVTPSQLRYRGIRGLDRNDIICAAELGYRIKMLASIRRVRDHAEVVVQPALVSATHMLAGIGGVYNAVMVNGDLTGRTLYYGRGAGRYPTGAAILGDLADAASRLRSSGPWNTSGFVSGEGRVRIQDPDAIMSRRYLRLTLADRPGILSCVTRMLSDQNISLAAVLQRESEMDGETPVILLTHPAPGRAFKTALKEIKELDGVLSPAVTFRIEDTGQGSAG